MPEYKKRKRRPYRIIECPHCGNEITAVGTDDEQKCQFCRRKYKIDFTKHGKKFHWEPIAIDYNYEAEGRPYVGSRLEREVNGRYGRRQH